MECRRGVPQPDPPRRRVRGQRGAGHALRRRNRFPRSLLLAYKQEAIDSAVGSCSAYFTLWGSPRVLKDAGFESSRAVRGGAWQSLADITSHVCQRIFLCLHVDDDFYVSVEQPWAAVVHVNNVSFIRTATSWAPGAMIYSDTHLPVATRWAALVQVLNVSFVSSAMSCEANVLRSWSAAKHAYNALGCHSIGCQCVDGNLFGFLSCIGPDAYDYVNVLCLAVHVYQPFYGTLDTSCTIYRDSDVGSCLAYFALRGSPQELNDARFESSRAVHGGACRTSTSDAQQSVRTYLCQPIVATSLYRILSLLPERYRSCVSGVLSNPREPKMDRFCKKH